MEGSDFISNKSKAISFLCLAGYVIACLAYLQFPNSEYQVDNSWEALDEFSLINQAEYAKIEDLLWQMVHNNPHNKQLQLNFEAIQNLRQASATLEHHLKMSVKLEPNNLQNLYSYALFLVSEGKYREAEEHLVKAATISPAFGKSENLLMEVYHRTENWNQLQKLALEIIRSNAHDEIAHSYLEIAKDKKTVLNILKEVTKTNPTALNHVKMSKELHSQRLYAQSFHYAHLALQRQPDFSDAQLQLILVYLKLGEQQKALKSLKNNLNMEADLHFIKENLALLPDYPNSSIVYQ
ncbi:tetratricopeptide repeat protein [Flagellimonas sp. 2504JD4-2]